MCFYMTWSIYMVLLFLIGINKFYVYCPSNTFNHVRLFEIHLSCFTYWILVILSIKIYVLNLKKKHPPGWRICIALCISCMHFNFFWGSSKIFGEIIRSKDSLFLLLKFEKNLKSSHSNRWPWKKKREMNRGLDFISWCAQLDTIRHCHL